MERLFSYGTLQQHNVQIKIFGRKLQGTKDTLIGYILSKIKIRDKQVIKTSGKKIHPILKFTGNNSDEIRGTIFELSLLELAQADKYEVEDYKRIKVTLKSGTIAWIYNS